MNTTPEIVYERMETIAADVRRARGLHPAPARPQHRRMRRLLHRS